MPDAAPPTPLEVLRAFRPHDGTLASLLSARVEAAPARTFLVHQDRELSWADFAQTVGRVAALLAERGIGAGDRVALLTPNHALVAVLFFAVAHLGATFVPLNPELHAAELARLLVHLDALTLVTTPATRPLAEAASANLVRAPALLDLADLDAAPQAAVPAPSTDPASVCALIATSGTTGDPRGVLHTQRTVILAGEAFVERMHLHPGDRLLCVLPLFHINALFYSLVGAMCAAATLVLASRFSASAFWPLVAASGATEANLLGTVGAILARRPRSEFVPGHQLRKIYAAPIPPALAEVFQREFQVPTLIEGYGMTEIPAVTTNPFLGPHKPGSMGRAAVHPDPALRLSELRVVDDEGRDLADGEVGELWVRTPLAMHGYHRDPEATRAAFRDGWFLTGDLVRREPDGFFTFIARKKDVIRRRGENISGAELDRVLGQHPEVAEVATIAVPSELGEDEILAVVVVRVGAALDAPALAAFAAAHLAAHKVPRFVVFVDALPHTPSHRVAKGQLRADPTLLARAVDLARTP